MALARFLCRAAGSPARRAAYGAVARRRNTAPALGLLVLLAALVPARAEQRTFTLVALGDSLTHGYGLPPSEGFVPQLEAWLAARSPVPVRVVNAGVSGDTTAGGRARLDWSLAQGADAVLVELGGNDLLRGIDPAESRANLDAILAALRARGLPVILAGLPAPLNYGEEYKAAFDGMFPELAAKHGAVLYPFFLEGLRAGTDPAAAVGMMQEDGIHPSAEGVRRIVAHFGPVALDVIRRATGGS